jgi:outer membrane protein W
MACKLDTKDQVKGELMKRLIALFAISAFVAHANAVTASNTSTAEAPKKRYVINTMTTPIPAAAPAAPEAAPQVAPEAQETAPVTAEANPAPTQDLTLEDDKALAQEVQAAEVQQTVTRVERSNYSQNNFYIGGSFGFGAYPEANNIQSGAAVNLSFGYILSNAFMFELGAGYSQFKMDAPNFTIFNRRDEYDINQYSAQLAAKYRLLDGPIVPNVGVLVSYTQRQLTLKNPFNTTNGQPIDAGTTNATDAGLSAGLEYEINETFALGADLRYMFNVANNAGDSGGLVVNNNFTNNTAVEKLQYYNAGITARVNF